MATIRYSLARCTFEVDGYTLSGFGVNGGVKITMPESAEMEHGADGDHALNVIKADHGDVEITLLPGSVANKYLHAILGAQQNEDTLTKRAVHFKDHGNGDQIDATYFVILSPPDFGLGKTNAERVWKCSISGLVVQRAANISG